MTGFLHLTLAAAAGGAVQLAAARLAVPHAGAGAGTWAGLLAGWLAGLAAGNAVGGRLPATRRELARAFAGAAVLCPWPLFAAEFTGLPGPLFAALLGLPPAFALGVPMPLAVRRSGREPGRAAAAGFAATTLGGLAGTLGTGFWLIGVMGLDAIFFSAAAAAGVAAVLAAVGKADAVSPTPAGGEARPAAIPPRTVCAYCAAAAAGASTLLVEVAAGRMASQVLGSGLATWAAVIAATLFGNAAGNYCGGRVRNLPATLVTAAAVTAVTPFVFILLAAVDPFAGWGPFARAAAWAFAVFAAPAFALGLITPQLCRGANPGLIAGAATLAAAAAAPLAGLVLVPEIGMYRTVLLAAALPLAAAVPFGLFPGPGRLLAWSFAAGTVSAGLTLLTPEAVHIAAESQYSALRVVPDRDRPDVLKLQLDRLVHSWVKPADPSFLHYRHEQVQAEFLRATGGPVLVIGGGGYTFPRAALHEHPGETVDVVEIDRKVTDLSSARLGLAPTPGLNCITADGRRFLADRAAAGRYRLITLDAVNDLTVPWHLLTRECNALAAKALAPGGVYLVSVIDRPDGGRLWPAVAATLKHEFRCVEVIRPAGDRPPDRPGVLVVFASNEPLDWALLRAATKPPPLEVMAAVAGPASAAQPGRFSTPGPAIPADPGPVLTDNFAPVEQLLGR